MDKYDPLHHFLKKNEGKQIKLTFTQVESIISDKLPMSASKYREWWANGGHIQANAWLDAKWKVDRVKLGEYVEFVKAN